MKIIEGNIVGLPSPRSDWNQTDEKKADYIKNKPQIKDLGYIQSIYDLDDYNTLSHCGIYTAINLDAIWETPQLIIISLMGASDFDINTPEVRQTVIGCTGGKFNMFYRDYTYVSETEGQWSKIHVPDYDLKTELQPYLHSAEKIDSMIKQYVHPVPATPEIATVNLVANTSYNLTYLEDVLALNFPQTANDGDVIYVTFLCYHDNLTLWIDTTHTSDIDLVPEYGVGYEIYAKFNGEIWVLGYSEYTKTDGEAI